MTTTTVTASYLNPDETACSGRVVFQLVAATYHDGLDAIFPTVPVTAVLDDDGAISVELEPTSGASAEFDATDMTYQVRERINGADRSAYYVDIPSSASVDLGTLVTYDDPLPVTRELVVPDLSSLGYQLALGWVNVKDYGAYGDGTHDDTAAIQLALDDVPSTGGTVYFPTGEYKVTAEVTCDEPASIAGDGPGSVHLHGGSRIVYTPTTGNCLTLSAPGSVVRDIGLFHDWNAGYATAGVGLNLTDFDFGRITNVLVDGFYTCAKVSGHYWTLSDSIIANFRNIGVWLTAPIDEFDWGAATIAGNIITKYGDTSAGGTGIYWDAGGGHNIIGNYLNGGAQPDLPSTAIIEYGIRMHTGGSSSSSMRIIGNGIENCSVCCIGIDTLTASSDLHKIVISGNQLMPRGNTSTGIYLNSEGRKGSLHEITVTGNTGYVVGNGTMIKAVGVDGLIIEGNTQEFLDSGAKGVILAGPVDATTGNYNVRVGKNVYTLDVPSGAHQIYGDSNEPALSDTLGAFDMTDTMDVSAWGASGTLWTVDVHNYSVVKGTIRVLGSVKNQGSLSVVNNFTLSRVAGFTSQTVIGSDEAYGVAAANYYLSGAHGSGGTFSLTFEIPDLTSSKSFYGKIVLELYGAVKGIYKYH